MKPKFWIVKIAYEYHACLHFQIRVNRPECLKAARLAGAYNDFSPTKLARFLRLLPIGTRLEFGRDFSPVLWVFIPNLDAQATLELVKNAARKVDLMPDEVAIKNGVWIRLWWD